DHAGAGRGSRKPPFGTPGVAKLSAIDDATMVRYSLTPNGTPYRRARNMVPVSHAMAFPTLNDDTARGSTNPACDGGTSRRPAESMSAGSDASEELELNATACAGRPARKNRGSRTPPPTPPMTQITSVSTSKSAT